MSKRIRRLRPSPVLVVSVAVLGLAAGGVASAAPTDSSIQSVRRATVKKIAKNQANKAITARAPGLRVLSAQTAAPVGPAGGDLTGTYPNPTIAPNAVTTAKIADNAVTTAKIADNAVTSAKIADSAVRARELTNTVQVGNTIAIAANGTGAVSVACPAGTQSLSGGGTTSSFGVHMVSSLQQGNGWIAAFQNTTAAAQTITVFAVCLAG